MTSEIVKFISYFALLLTTNIYVDFLSSRCKTTKEKVICYSLFFICLTCAFLYGEF